MRAAVRNTSGAGNAPASRARKDLRKPLWLGETPLAGKTILLHAEQGLGDTVMFARYAPLLGARRRQGGVGGAAGAQGLLAGLDGVAAIVARGEPLPPFDVHCPLTSLPLACKTELSNVPAEIPYLHASAALIAKWRSRLECAAGAACRAGLVRPRHPCQRPQPLAVLSQLEPLLVVDAVRFVSMQRELRPADAEALCPRAAHRASRRRARRLRRHRRGAGARRSGDLRRHLGRACRRCARAGRPGCCCRSSRTGAGRSSASAARGIRRMRLFRQPATGEWASVIAQVREELALLR